MFRAEVALFGATVYATMGDLDVAAGAVGAVKEPMLGLGASARADYCKIWCRYYLLEGEIAFARGRPDAAKKIFQNCKFLVDHNGAAEFADVVAKRLELVGT